MAFMSLLFALFSLSTATLPAIMRDPQQFIQSLDTLDPVVIDKMITMVNQLIVDGEAERQGHHDRQERAQNRHDVAVTAEAKASSERDIAAGHVKNQEDVVAAATMKEQSAKDIRDEKRRVHTAATTDAEKKAEFRKSEVARIDAEKDLLQQIVVKLESLLPGVSMIEGRLTVTDYIIGRNLLENSNADRDAVQKVVDKVNAMVGRGEGQRKAVIKADEDAQAALVAATAELKDAVEKYEAAAKDLASAQAELSRLNDILTVKEELLANARNELGAAIEDLAVKKHIREQEDIRLDNEKETCEEILKILKDLKSRA